MQKNLRKFFERYAQVFRSALRGSTEMDEVASLYAPAFIAATPAGVIAGKNDKQLKKAMAKGYAQYRAQGMKDMRIRRLGVSPIDDQHCMAHVAWRATYARKDQKDVAIDFEVHYFVQDAGSGLKVFGWVSGDEHALLRKHGIV